MYLFGGSGPRTLRDYPALWTLDMKTLRWDSVNNSRGDAPITRDEHTAVLYNENNQIIIFGGFVNGERTNEIDRYSIKENTWERLKIKSTLSPSPRAGHSAVIHGQNMVVFGGRDENERLNDTWIFNM